jgi:hypothetical protein
MGSQTFDFLTDSFLFQDACIQSQFSTVTESEIQKELARYRDFCISKQSELEQEVLLGESNLKGASHFRENRVRGENREVAPEKTHHDTRRPKAPGILYGRNCRDFVPQ